MSTSKRPKRPCGLYFLTPDRCRAKKRKCDGNLPCSTCERCRTGDAVCQYTNAPPVSKELIKDEAYEKLKYLESVLNSIMSNSSSYGTSGPPKVVDRLDMDNLSFGSSYSSMPDSFGHYNHQLGNQFNVSEFPLDVPLNSHSLDSFMLGSSTNSFNLPDLHNHNMANDIFSDLFQPPPDDFIPQAIYTEDDVEEHLIGLSFLYYCGHTSKPNLSSTIPLYRGSPLSPLLRKAICFHSVFLSQHPKLFPTPPTFQDRLAVAERFAIDSSLAGFMESIDPNNNQQVCDGIRALLVHVISQFSIGNPVTSIDLLCKSLIDSAKAASYLRHFGILNKKSLEDHSKGSVTLDDYVALDIQPSLQLSEKERAERFALLALILGIDTYGSMTSGNGFFIDESDFPESLIPTMPLVIDSRKSARHFVPGHGKDTVWQGTAFGALFDEMREISVVINDNQPSLALTSQFQLLLMKLIRKILRFSRGQKYAKGSEESRFSQVILHNSLLQFLMMAPSTLLIFRSLSAFAWGVPKNTKEYSTTGQDSLAHSLVFISAFAYLHFTSAMAGKDTLFALEIGGPCTFTSRDVLYSLLQCLNQIILTSEKPFLPDQSIFGQHFYTAAEMHIPSAANSNSPSPLFCQALNSLMSFVVSSSALIAFKKPDADPAQAQSVIQMVGDTVLPSLKKIDKLWPGSVNFTSRLEVMLREF